MLQRHADLILASLVGDLEALQLHDDSRVLLGFCTRRQHRDTNMAAVAHASAPVGYHIPNWPRLAGLGMTWKC